ncbi:MAG: MBL fold metallo-hydrolase [Chitinophagaceae bacterium]|nr:MBL fold metallo-hydrolase [Chitinophagaceae bacterium]
MDRIRNSVNYRKGQFQNQSITPQLAEGVGFFSVMRKFFFTKRKRNKPSGPVPSVKTNLLQLPAGKDVIVWFGHSSYFIQVDGKKILVDPVFSGSASPIPPTTKSFPGSDIYTTDDLPEIDILFISHDHWDHLDYETVLQLRSKVKKVITGLGTAAHLLHWGYDPSIIEEKDWNEEVILENGFRVNTIPARHFSGRGFKPKQSLWMSFALKTPTMNIFLGGDSGYDAHFKRAGEAFGPFDLAILECGQYNKDWPYIHMQPQEVMQAAKDLRADRLMPVHWAKFSLALHEWDEPIRELAALSVHQNIPLLTPLIGQAAELKATELFPEWWNTIR